MSRTISWHKEWMSQTIQRARRDRFLQEHFVMMIPVVLGCEPLMIPERGQELNPEVLWQVVQHVVGRLWDKIDVARLCVMGFSSGADTTVRLALRYGSALAAIAPIAGLCDFVDELDSYDALQQMASLPVRVFHSENDDHVKADSCRALMRWFGRRSALGRPSGGACTCACCLRSGTMRTTKIRNGTHGDASRGMVRSWCR